MKSDPIQYPVDQDNEAIILANAIKDAGNREVFIRKVRYNQFRMKEFQTVSWGIIEAVKNGMEVNIDAILLKSKTCPVRYLVDYNFLVELCKNFNVVPKANYSQHIEKLSIDHVKASILDKGFTSLMKSCLSNTTSLSDIDARIRYLDNIVQTGYSSSQLDFKSLDEVAIDFEREKERENNVWSTGFTDLDYYLTEGLKPKQLSATVGLSSAGKSSFALSMMKNLSNIGVPTAQFALEMNNVSLCSKLLAFNTRLPVSRVVSKIDQFTEEELKLYLYELERLKKNKHIMFNDKPSQSLASIREQTMLLQDFLQQEYIMIVIDLFGKIKEFQSSDNFARDYEKRMNEVQNIAKELGVHINLVAQIRRDVSARKNSRPTMHDLKNSGAITEGFDLIFGIHRPFYDPETALREQVMQGHTNQYGPSPVDEESEENAIEDPNKYIAEVILLKQRMGINNVLVNFIFDTDTTCFFPITAEYQSVINELKGNM
jgi:replicative DNA helicase